MEKKKLPVGVEFFDELIKETFYYVDKTDMLAELLKDWGKVNLFTRPRRFGKSLNMRMMQSFFEIGANPHLFEGLKISKERTLCEKYMGKFPVISITLKNVEGTSFEAAKKSLKDTVERILPSWKEEIFPSLTHIDQILVTAHGNSLRGIIKYLKNISDEDIVGLNLPTAVPYVFDFDNDLRLINDYFLGDPEEIKKLMEAVAKQGQKK